MKPDDVIITQFQVEPYTWYESNGSMYKTKNEGHRIFGLGSDFKIYRYGKHTIYSKETSYQDFTGWREYTPSV